MSDVGLLARRTPSRGLVISAIVAVLIGLLSAVNAPPARAAGPCGPPVTSVIACENTLPGDPPSDWQVNGAGDSTIQGFATSMSVNAGRDGILQDQHPGEVVPHRHPARRLLPGQRCPQGGLQDAADRHAPADPAGLPQRCRRHRARSTAATGPCRRRGRCRPTRSPACTSPTWSATTQAAAASSRSSSATTRATPTSLFQTSDETWQAYNTYGGNSLYTCTRQLPAREPGGLQGRRQGVLQPAVRTRRWTTTAGAGSCTPSTR